MNCLLIMPSTRGQDGDYSFFYDFPLGIAYISSALKQVPEFNITTLNLNQIPLEQTSDNRRKAIADSIDACSADVVLTGGLCTLYPQITEILEVAKQRDGVTTVVGGGIISGDPDAAMQALELADYGVIGEGERTIVELCRALQEEKPVDGVQGIVYRKGDRLVTTKPRPVVEDLSELPWCDYEGFGVKEYLTQSVNSSLMHNNRLSWESIPALSVLTSRSCRQQCTFCFHPEGNIYRQRSVDDIFAELDRVVERYQPGFISFVDQMVGLSQPNLEEFCRRVERYGIPWNTSFRVNDITEDKVRVMRESNCKAVMLGLESACDEILRSMRKGTTVARMETALDLCREHRLAAMGILIFGDPEETYETCMETLDWYLAHPLYLINLSEMWYYPGSDVYWRAVKAGKIADRVQYLKGNASAMAFNFTKMTDDKYNEIIRVKIPEYRERRQALLPDLHDARVTHDGTSITLAGKCGFCGGTLEFRDLSPLGVRSPFVCGICSTPLAVSAFKRVEFVRANLDYLVSTHGEVAFWGIGNRFRLVMDPSYLDDPRIHLVDRNHGGVYGRKPIEPLDVISKRNISVIIAPPRRDNACPGIASHDIFEEISAEARSEYRVSKVIDLFDLWYFDLWRI